MRVYKTEEVMAEGREISVARADFQNGINVSHHTHDFIEIVYVLSGKIIQIIDGKTYETSHGDILFMNYGCGHSFSAEGEASYINVLFSPKIISEDIVTPYNAFSLLSLTAFDDMRSNSDFGKISFFGNERREIEDIILAMLRENREKSSSYNEVIGSYLNILIIKMLRKTEIGIERGKIGDVWAELSHYIDENLDTKLTLSALAERCFYNPSYFSRVFKDKFGVSLMEYIATRRVEHAIDLLASTDFTLEKVAEESGFSGTAGLYHAFSRYLGTTPSEYRRDK